MSGLKVKYFILNPESKVFGDRYAEASRKAMRAYANHIYKINEELAKDLRDWANREMEKSLDLEEAVE